MTMTSGSPRPSASVITCAMYMLIRYLLGDPRPKAGGGPSRSAIDSEGDGPVPAVIFAGGDLAGRGPPAHGPDRDAQLLRGLRGGQLPRPSPTDRGVEVVEQRVGDVLDTGALRDAADGVPQLAGLDVEPDPGGHQRAGLAVADRLAVDSGGADGARRLVPRDLQPGQLVPVVQVDPPLAVAADPLAATEVENLLGGDGGGGHLGGLLSA